jgi:hypothetical protein
MSDKIRVALFGPGRIGGHAIWEIEHSKEFELVAVRGYLPEELGRDAGELIGIDALGITITDDVESIIALDIDCVLFLAHETPDYATDAEILQLLAAGKNLVTILPYQNAHLFREPEFVTALEEACAAGQSTFFAGGIDPDFVSERLMLALTSATTDVTTIRIQEAWDTSAASELALKAIGFAIDPEIAATMTNAQASPRRFQTAVLRTTERALGVTFDRIEEDHTYVPVEEDVLEPFFIPKGNVGRVSHRLAGYVDSIGTEPLFEIILHWHIGDSTLPRGIKPGQDYVVTIEGRPSMHMTLDFSVSNESEAKVFELGSMKVQPTYAATLMSVMQSIPHVVAGEPGILPSFTPRAHWMPDLRDTVRPAEGAATEMPPREITVSEVELTEPALS